MKYQVFNPQDEVVAEFIHDTHARLFITTMNTINQVEKRGKYTFRPKQRAKGWASMHWATKRESGDSSGGKEES